MLTDLDIPLFVKISQEQRAAAWARNPPREAKEAERMREVDRVRAEEKKRASYERIEKMKLKKARPTNEDIQGKTWDPRRGRWVADVGLLPTRIEDTVGWKTRHGIDAQVTSGKGVVTSILAGTAPKSSASSAEYRGKGTKRQARSSTQRRKRKA